MVLADRIPVRGVVKVQVVVVDDQEISEPDPIIFLPMTTTNYSFRVLHRGRQGRGHLVKFVEELDIVNCLRNN
jgi:hypothetical protein